MDGPEWVAPPLRPRLQLALAAQPQFAEEALADLEAVTAGWDEARRTRLVERVVRHALLGKPLPAALMVALGELLDA